MGQGADAWRKLPIGIRVRVLTWVERKNTRPLTIREAIDLIDEMPEDERNALFAMVALR